MPKAPKFNGMAQRKTSVLTEFDPTSGIGDDAAEEITVTDSREPVAQSVSPPAEIEKPSSSAGAPMAMPPARPARKQGAGRKKRLLIGARFKEEDMGPTFELVQKKLGRMLGVGEDELSMQELMGAVVRATIQDDQESLKWLAGCVLRERERIATEMKNAANL